MRASDSPSAVFVYGTLKRGHCRAHHWPHPPLSVQTATTLGRLIDLGPYPALVAGEQIVEGQLWRLAPRHLADTLRALDDVEGFVDGQSDLYRRQVISCRTADGQVVSAHAYFWAHPESIVDYRVVAPEADGRCRWNAPVDA